MWYNILEHDRLYQRCLAQEVRSLQPQRREKEAQVSNIVFELNLQSGPRVF